MVLGDGLAVVSGGVALFPCQRPLGVLILHSTRDINVALAETLAAGQIAVLLHHQRRVLEQKVQQSSSGTLPPLLGISKPLFFLACTHGGRWWFRHRLWPQGWTT